MRLSVKSAALFAGTAYALICQSAQAQTTPAPAAAGAPAADSDAIPDIVVTAQKRSESLQRVPLAVTSLSQEDLRSRGVVGSEDLRTQVPNLAFSRTTVDNFNVQIRGVGTPLADPSADPAVGIHVNNVPLTTSRFGDTDFYDVERVEVLRGPQGTLYGRNATGGVVNIITAQPRPEFSASITGEAGNFGRIKFTGYVNVPLGDVFALRAAGYFLSHDGYSHNSFTGTDVDDRDLWATRLTLSVRPGSAVRAFLLWEHFNENDHRLSSSRLACTPDPGPASVGGVPTNPVTRGLLSQGCLDASIYTDAARGAPNSGGTIEGIIGLLTGTINNNFNAGVQQPRDLRQFAAPIDPTYRAKSDLVEASVEWDVAHGLQFTSLTSYSEDHSNRRGDVGTYIPTGRFNNTPLTPGGVLTDPQFGQITFPRSNQIITNDTRQWTQELRLQSSFDGPLNFNVGGIYIDYRTDQNFILNTSSFTLLSRVQNLSGAGIYIDQDPNIAGDGHNYLRNYRPYRLRSAAAFGELYFKPADTLTLTLGLRYTNDSKREQDIPNTLFAPGRGLPAGTPLSARFSDLSGRFNIAWRPDLGFTDQTMFYASAARGYKGGGINSPAAAASVNVLANYRPEFVNAIEFGTRNTFAGGRVIFNASGFYYDYSGLQITKFANLIPIVENIDATVYGVELETTVQPFRGLRLNGALGLLHTSIGSSSSIDLLNRTQGNPNLTLVKSTQANCVVPTSSMAALLAAVNAGSLPSTALVGVCSGAFAGAPFNAVPSTGVPADLSGNDLPNAPHWTLSLGAEYRFDLGGGWNTAIRGDYYRQGTSFNRIYNSAADRARGWQNINLSVTFASQPLDLDIRLFVRNLTNEQIVLSAAAAGLNDINGLRESLFLNEPRIYGLSLTKRF